MDKTCFEIVTENKHKRLLRFLPEDEGCYVEGATKDEITENFPEYPVKELDFLIYTYLIEENNIIHIKGPDGVDITEEIYGKDCFKKNLD